MFRRSALALIRFYQKGISPFTRPSCRFVPTCSAYAHEAIERYGLARGGWLFLRRFARCHPFGGKGYDPVPVRGASESASELLRGTDPGRDTLPHDGPEVGSEPSTGEARA